MAAAVPPFLPQNSDPPPKAARSSAIIEPASNAPRPAEAPPPTSKRSTLESAAKLLAPGFVDSYERLAQALVDLERSSSQDHAALLCALGLLQTYMGLQPFKLGNSGFSGAFDSVVLPRLVATLSAFLDQLTSPRAARTADAPGSVPVTVELAEECLLCLVNMSACDGQMAKLLLRHGVAAVVARILLSRAPHGLLENAAWVLGNLAGDSLQSREQVISEHGLWALLGRLALELRTLGYFPFNVLFPAVATSASPTIVTESDASSASTGAVLPAIPTSSLLKICSWAVVNACEGQTRPPCPLEYILPVLSALLDSPDSEVQCHACWTLSHVCDGTPADISCVIAGLELRPSSPPCPLEPLLATASHSAEAIDVLTALPFLAQRLIGGWTRSPFSLALDPPAAQRPGPPALPHVTARSSEGSSQAESPLRLVSTAAKLVRFLRHESLRVCKPALRAVGNIVCAEDDCDLTQNMVDLGVVPLLAALVRSPARDIQKEVCWTLSNVGAGSQYQIQALLDSGCLTTIFELCLDPAADVGVRTEACWIVLNATSCGSERQIETLVRAGAVRVLCSLMKDASLVMMALEGLEKILQVCERLSGAALTLMAAKGRGPLQAASHERTSAAGVDGKVHLAPLLDAPLEDVMLAEAKALLDTCKRELVERGTLQPSASASSSSASAVALGTASAASASSSTPKSDIFRKASKLWHSHFVSCELCHQSFSKASSMTSFCEECRCNVCLSCDCSVFHLSYQLALLGEAGSVGARGGRQKSRTGKKTAASTQTNAKRGAAGSIAKNLPASEATPTPLTPSADASPPTSERVSHEEAPPAPTSPVTGTRRRKVKQQGPTSEHLASGMPPIAMKGVASGQPQDGGAAPPSRSGSDFSLHDAGVIAPVPISAPTSRQSNMPRLSSSSKSSHELRTSAVPSSSVEADDSGDWQPVRTTKQQQIVASSGLLADGKSVASSSGIGARLVQQIAVSRAAAPSRMAATPIAAVPAATARRSGFVPAGGSSATNDAAHVSPPILPATSRTSVLSTSHMPPMSPAPLGLRGWQKKPASVASAAESLDPVVAAGGVLADPPASALSSGGSAGKRSYVLAAGGMAHLGAAVGEGSLAPFQAPQPVPSIRSSPSVLSGHGSLNLASNDASTDLAHAQRPARMISAPFGESSFSTQQWDATGAADGTFQNDMAQVASLQIGAFGSQFSASSTFPSDSWTGLQPAIAVPTFSSTGNCSNASTSGSGTSADAADTLLTHKLAQMFDSAISAAVVASAVTGNAAPPALPVIDSDSESLTAPASGSGSASLSASALEQLQLMSQLMTIYSSSNGLIEAPRVFPGSRSLSYADPQTQASPTTGTGTGMTNMNPPPAPAAAAAVSAELGRAASATGTGTGIGSAQASAAAASSTGSATGTSASGRQPEWEVDSDLAAFPTPLALASTRVCGLGESTGTASGSETIFFSSSRGGLYPARPGPRATASSFQAQGLTVAPSTHFRGAFAAEGAMGLPTFLTVPQEVAASAGARYNIHYTDTADSDAGVIALPPLAVALTLGDDTPADQDDSDSAHILKSVLASALASEVE